MVLSMFFIFLVGTAGSGKSLLTASLEKWLVESDLSVTVVNIDPGVESPPYTSDVDIREYVDYGEVMNNFGLGPNGALVASLDMGVGSVNELREEIIESERDYVLVDCPGQMELFAYRNSGPLMVSGLRGDDPSLSLYLLDSNIAKTPIGYLSSMLLGLSINIRFGLPQLNILSKTDILMEDEIEEIVDWGSEVHLLEEALDQSSEGLVREYSKSILDMLGNIGSTSVTVPVSSKDMTGFDLLYGEIQRIFSGGDNIYE
ncbi:MAG: ATP/GTP-binding protein [Candidatus Thorarchaeota archaeon]|nr:ATP/GTP-binding protein [Candidatus Thorarchaeota archaeon]